MKSALTLTIAAIALFGVAAQMAYGQKSEADPANADKQAVKPEIVSLSGRIVEIKTGSCEFATGQELNGEQVILDTAENRQLRHCPSINYRNPAIVGGDSCRRFGLVSAAIGDRSRLLQATKFGG